jgi:hypothetical protein
MAKIVWSDAGNKHFHIVPLTRVMLSSAFLQGWKSAKKGLPFDDLIMDVNYAWNYERGRQFGIMYPEFKQIRDKKEVLTKKGRKELIRVFQPAYEKYLLAVKNKDIL